MSEIEVVKVGELTKATLLSFGKMENKGEPRLISQVNAPIIDSPRHTQCKKTFIQT